MKTAQVKDFFLQLQASICHELEQADGRATFIKDTWDRPEGGGGVSALIQNGAVFEKGGVNFSHVYGDCLPSTATAHRPDLAKRPFQAMGVSLVMHPKSPMVPTVHMNVRFFISESKNNETTWWFGGGMDLTPYYPYYEDAVFWHTICQKACEHTPLGTYEAFKKECDDYFFLPHRNEARGVGGLFFDDLNDWGFEPTFNFVKNVGLHFNQGYLPIVKKRKDIEYHQGQKDFQLYRRGRYVEFNLLYDRGTIFGIQSKGRTESILMSLPPEVRWTYNWMPQPHTQEALLYDFFLKPQDWLAQPILTV